MIWNRLQHCISNCDGRVRLDVVLDNAGFELFTDMCLVDFLCSSNLVQEVYFHLKELPWFVSDATARDIEWTLQTLISFPDQPLLRHLGFKWQKFIETERWKMTSDPFWTLPHDFSVMNTVAPDLYTTLSQSHLVIFKGDLNYRKLTGDLMWDHTTAFHRALRGFHPTALCSLRTIKAEVVVGLKPLQAEATRNLQENWMTSSDFALIQFYANKFWCFASYY